MFIIAVGVIGFSLRVSLRYARWSAVIAPADSPAIAILLGFTPCWVSHVSAVFASSIATAKPILNAEIASGGAWVGSAEVGSALLR